MIVHALDVVVDFSAFSVGSSYSKSFGSLTDDSDSPCCSRRLRRRVGPGLGSGAAPRLVMLLVRLGRFFRLVDVDTTKPVVELDATTSDSALLFPSGIVGSMASDSHRLLLLTESETDDGSFDFLWSPSGSTTFRGGAGGLSPFFAGSSLGLG